MNARLFQETDSIMNAIQTQNNSAISSAINDCFLRIMGSLPLPRNRSGTGTSSNEQGLVNVWRDANTKLATKDSRSAFDLRENMDFTPYFAKFTHQTIFYMNEST